MNIFSKKNVPDVNFPRNTYDLSRRDMMTTKWGKLNVAYCKEVLPGDSWQLDSAVTVNAMPTNFPLSTPVKVYMHYYYSRCRTVWKDFPDFIFKTKDGLEMPWIRFKKDTATEKARIKEMIGTGSYGDSFNVPSTFAGAVDRTLSMGMSSVPLVIYRKPLETIPLVSADTLKAMLDTYDAEWYPIDYDGYKTMFYAIMHCYSPAQLASKVSADTIGSADPSTSNPNSYLMAVYEASSLGNTPKQGSRPIVSATFKINGYNVSTDTANYFEIPQNVIDAYNADPDHRVFCIMRSGFTDYSNTSDLSETSSTSLSNYNQAIPWPSMVIDSSRQNMPFNNVLLSGQFDSVVDITDEDYLDLNPFVGDTPDIQLSALPWRCVEQIYNYYYRDDTNNPYILNGETQYNEFIPTHDGGPDDNLYPTRYRNWERDRYTSCAPSPQFGDAPLVGLIARPSVDTAVVEFADADNNVYHATVGVDADNNVVSIVDYDANIPSGSLRYLQDSITSEIGFSINDLRNVNAFQRFKEHQLLRGLRYRNQLKSHMGVDVDYPDIDVPQFIGGYSGTLNTPRVMQSATTAEASLGDYNGQIVGTVPSQNTINCYCPEHGFIIGIMSIIPVPVYSQTLDPMMTRMSALDFFQQEFSKIGNVPIFMSEVAPVQSPNPSGIFGYNKAWSEYMQDTDHVHGDFRTNLKDFMLMRIFAGTPSLSRDFTVCDPDQLNDVFAAGKIADAFGSTDRLLCEVNTHAIVKRQIPKHASPSLE